MVLAGGDKTIVSWGQGNIYHGSDSKGEFVQGHISEPVKAPCLLDDSGRIVSRTHPQYEDYDVTEFVSVRDYGAMGLQTIQRLLQRHVKKILVQETQLKN